MGNCSSSPAGETERLQREQQARKKKHAIANSDSIRIMIDPPGGTVEIQELANVLVLLEKAALKLGLDRGDAATLQLEFSETILDHQLELKASGLCDESQCNVLDVEEAKANKAKRLGKSGALFSAADGRLGDVRLVCQYAPEFVNVAGRVMLPYLHCCVIYWNWCM